MKVIDLLNKIANGEEVPKKIKYNYDVYTHVDNYCYFCEEANEILSQNIYAEFSRLNDEIEIIEEDKQIEKLKIAFLDNYEPNEIDRKCWNRLNEHQDKINEIIDKVNELEREMF